MSAAITIAMPRMVPNQLLAEAHAKYPESLARAGAEMRWIELNDPEKAVQDALACDGLLLPGGGDIDPGNFMGRSASLPAVSPTSCGISPSRCCCAPSLPPTSRCWPSAGASS